MTKEVKKIGRPQGSPNKRTEELFYLAEKHDCNPFEILILFAKGDHEALGYEKHQTKTTKDGGTVLELTISPELRQKSARDAAEYLYPKRKAVEHSLDKDASQSIEEFLMGKNKEQP
jgi:hypothetical protein